MGPDLLQAAERGEAGPEADFVPLTPITTAQEWMDLILRCDTVEFDIVDTPPPQNLPVVVNILRTVEQYLPGTSHTAWKVINNWRISPVNRLASLHDLEDILTRLAAAAMHMLTGEYVAYMSPEEARVAAEDFVDSMEFTGQQISDFDATRRVGLVRVASIARKQLKLKVDDLAKDAPASQSSAVSWDDGNIPF